jgi:hypothetical protein
MPEYFDAEALLADCRRKQRRAGEVARRARRKLGVETGARRSPTYGRGDRARHALHLQSPRHLAQDRQNLGLSPHAPFWQEARPENVFDRRTR